MTVVTVDVGAVVEEVAVVDVELLSSVVQAQGAGAVGQMQVVDVVIVDIVPGETEVSEVGPAPKVEASPLHPYTRALIESVPTRSRKEGRLKTIPGSTPNMLSPPAGCRFHPRCPMVMDVCRTKSPEFVEKDGRSLRCFLYE